VDDPSISVLADLDIPGGFLVEVGGTPQSYIDTTDPANLLFEYVRRIGHVVDLMAPDGDPITAVHLGGGGFTLPRYIAHTRPGSRQQIIEISRELIDRVRAAAPLPKREPIRVRCGDAREAASILPGGMRGTVDLLVLDVFAGSRVPGKLTSTEFFESLRPLLAPGAVLAANIADGSGQPFARAVAATLTEVFGPVRVMAEPAVLKGRRFGNLVLLAGAVPDGLVRRLASDPFPATLLDGDEARRFAAAAKAVTDATAVDSPIPPRGAFGR
jgi:hypothetical protein